MNVDIWRDAAIIWLALLCFVALLPPIVILYIAVRGMGEFSRKMPNLLGRIRAQNHSLRESTERASARVNEPVTRFQQRVTRIENSVGGLFVSKHDREDTAG